MKYIIILATILLCIGNSSCKKFLDVAPPKDKLVTSSVFENDETAIAALTGIYSRMYAEGNFSLGYNIPFQLSLSADELKAFSTNVDVIRLYTNSLNALNVTTPNFWQMGYNFIYNANAVYEGCGKSTAISAAIRKQLMAEALFIRGWWHFFLTNLYGDIPIVLNNNYEENRLLSRSKQQDVYDQIITDLALAKSEISEQYLAGNSVNSSTDRVRPNKAVVTAFLARVYLYAGKNQDAEAAATALINNITEYKLATTVSAFLKGSPEAIWQIMTPLPSATTLNTFEALGFTLTAKPTSSVTTSSTLSTALLNAFETTDKRKSDWIGKYTDKTVTPNIDYYYPAKYKSTSTTVSSEYSIMLRLAEQYLIRAEARLKQNKLLEAADDINAIRFRAGLTNTTANDQESLAKAIALERRLELFTEYGHRWFDLKRTNKIDEVMQIAATTKGGVWASYKQLFPIPLREIQSNPNMKQNPGYNQ